MALIDLVRHGETESPGLLLGRTDAPISQAGWQQIERQTAGREWDRIFASPLARARVPAERLAQSRKLELSIDPDWAEIDFGAWDGRPISELSADPVIAETMDALYRNPADWTSPGGESWRALQDRIASALSRLAQLGERERALVVSHAGPMRSAVSLACDIPFERLWAVRIAHATRLTLRIGNSGGGHVWGEIVEIVQA